MPTQKSLAALISELNANINTNGTNAITGQIMNDFLNNLLISYPNKITEASLLGLFSYDPTRTYLLGQGVIYSGDLWECTAATTTGAFDPTKWDKKTGSVAYDVDALLKLVKNYINIKGSLNQDIYAYSSKVAETTFAANIDSGMTKYCGVALANGDYMVLYADNADSDKGKLKKYDKAGSAVGATITWLTSGVNTIEAVNILNEDYVLIAYTLNADGLIRIKIVDNAGTTVTTVASAISTGTAVDLRLTTLTNGNIAMAWSDSSDSNKGKHAIVANTGAVVLAETTFDTVATDISISALANGNYVIFYIATAAASGAGKYIIYDNQGTEVKAITALSSNIAKLSSVSLHNGDVAVTYRDSGDSNKGKFILMSIDGILGSAITYSTNTVTLQYSASLPNGDFIIGHVDTSYNGYIFRRYDDKGGLKESHNLRTPGGTAIKVIVLTNGNIIALYEDSNVGYFQIWQGSTVFSTQPIYNDGVNYRKLGDIYTIAIPVVYGDFTATGLTETIELYELPTGTKLLYINAPMPDTDFSGGAIASYKVKIGVTGLLDKFVSDTDVFTGTTEIMNANTGEVDYASPISIKVTATTTVGNLNTATAGAMNIYLTLHKII